jgi:hypothetical protein
MHDKTKELVVVKREQESYFSQFHELPQAKFKEFIQCNHVITFFIGPGISCAIPRMIENHFGEKRCKRLGPYPMIPSDVYEFHDTYAVIIFPPFQDIQYRSAEEKSLFWVKIDQLITKKGKGEFNPKIVFQDNNKAFRANDSYPLFPKHKETITVVPFCDKREYRISSDISDIDFPKINTEGISLKPEELLLLKDMYANFNEVRLHREISEGVSVARTFVLQIYGKSKPTYELIKIGPKDIITTEVINYHRYVQSLLKDNAAELKRPSIQPEYYDEVNLAGFSTEYLHAERMGNTIHPLTYYLNKNEFIEKTLKKIIQKLLNEVLSEFYEKEYKPESISVNQLKYVPWVTDVQRMNLIKSKAKEVFKVKDDKMDDPNFPLSQLNPLKYCNHLLNQSFDFAHKSLIIGDLNLSNIFVKDKKAIRPEDILLIDFAYLRHDHIMFDFALLEAEIIVRIIADKIPESEIALSEFSKAMKISLDNFVRYIKGSNKPRDILKDIPAGFTCYFDLIMTIRYEAIKRIINICGREKKRAIKSDYLEYLTALYFECLLVFVIKDDTLSSWARKLIFISAGHAAKKGCELLDDYPDWYTKD